MIETTDHGPVRLLRMNHPPANAIGPELVAALRTALAAAPAAGARGLVLSGRPGMFSGGLDVPRLLQVQRDDLLRLWQGFYSLLHELAASPLPVVAAISGHSPAGGAVLSIFCDYRVMAAGRFKIGLNEVRVGLALPPLVYRALVHLLGQRRGELLAVTGQLIEPEAALQLGLVDEVVAPEAVEERAITWCQELLALPPEAVALTRRRARQALVDLCQQAQSEPEALLDDWYSPETQATLNAVAAQLTQKKG